MTTMPTYRPAAVIGAELRRLWVRRRRVAMATAACAMVTMAAAMVVTITLAAGYWPGQPPEVLRWVLPAVTIAIATVTTAAGPVRAMLWRQNDAQNARFAEERIGGLDNGLINTLQLSADAKAGDRLAAAAIRETAAKVRKLDLTRAAGTEHLRRLSWLAAASMVMALALCLTQWPRVTRAMTAVFRPGAYVPTIGAVEVLSVTPGDVTVYSGSRVAVTVTIANDEQIDYAGQIVCTDAANPTGRARSMMIAADRRTYSLPLGTPTDDLRYFVRIGDTRIPSGRPGYLITVIDQPGVAGLDATYRYPDYIGRDAARSTDIAGPIRAPAGTKVALTVRLHHRAAGAILRRKNAPPAPMAAADDGQTFASDMSIPADGGYGIWLTDDGGRVIQRLPDGDDSNGWFAITALADAAPVVAFRRPAANVIVAPGGSVDVALHARDDYGLTAATLSVSDADGRQRSLHQFPLAATPTEAKLTHSIDIPADTPVGTVLTCTATATDNRRLGDLGPQTAAAANGFEILVRNPQALEAAKAERFAELHSLIEALLRTQLRTKLAAIGARDRGSAKAAFDGYASAAAEGQIGIRTETARILAEFSFTAPMAPARDALAMMRTNEMTQACNQAAVVATVADLTARGRPCDLLIGTQDRIIEGLQMLLAYLPMMARDPADRLDTAGGEDLAPEYAERLRELAADLTQLAGEHARVIPAAERLAKKPVDQFSPDDEQLLHELRAIEDKWESFLTDAFTDFSKLTQQDFSNPSLLTELLSVRADVTMAKDALAARAVEIAVASESMTSAGENAEELTANIEKWLPDVPDRQQWNMEDPGGIDNVELPELPSELEDLIGDLLEQEEDLFAEMQDVTSQAADSFDEGAGWLAVDGPISSMNAQGVTGNMLPNSSEISGRSGEGRQGKSTGEFVQDTFVGKGGRRTSTRLTPEPFSTGQIKDESTTPPGGATGGGKIGGAAGEGLEGPVPPPLQRELERLAGRQAHLINNAERMRERFAASDYSGFAFQRAVTLMNRVRGDLARNDYRSALRRRDTVLEALRDSRDALAGPVEVIRDASGPVPKHIRHDIDQARQRPLPQRYRKILQSYLQKLAGGR